MTASINSRARLLALLWDDRGERLAEIGWRSERSQRLAALLCDILASLPGIEVRGSYGMSMTGWVGNLMVEVGELARTTRGGCVPAELRAAALRCAVQSLLLLENADMRTEVEELPE